MFNPEIYSYARDHLHMDMTRGGLFSKASLPHELFMDGRLPLDTLPDMIPLATIHNTHTYKSELLAFLLARNGMFLIDMNDENYRMAGTIDEQNIIHWWIFTKINGVYHSSFSASRFYEAAYQYFQRITNGNISGILGWWVDGDNRDQYLESRRKGMSIADSARSTWSGRQAIQRGFTEVEHVPTSSLDCKFIFRKAK